MHFILPTLSRLARALLALTLLHPLGHVLPAASARATNRTIDDERGDNTTGLKPTYSPATAWAQGAGCTSCSPESIDVDASRVFDGTWHAATYDPSDLSARTINATFSGSGVYVFYALSNDSPAPAATFAGLTFVLDGEYAGSFVHIPNGDGVMMYNVLVYSNHSLHNGAHTLQIQTSGPATPNALFDYVVYTVQDDASSPANASHRHSSHDHSNSHNHGHEQNGTSSQDHRWHNNGDYRNAANDSPLPSTTIGTALGVQSTSESDTSPSDNDSQGSPRFHNGGGGGGGGHRGSHHSDKAGVIVGGTIGGVAVLAIVIGVLIYLRRRPANRKHRSGNAAAAADGDDDGDDDEKQLRAAHRASSAPASASAHQPQQMQDSPDPGTGPRLAPLPAPGTTAPVLLYVQPTNTAPRREMDLASEFSSPVVPTGTTWAAVAAAAALRSPGSSKRTQRQAELAYQIRALEAQLRTFESESEPEPAAGAERASPVTGRAPASATEVEAARAMQDEIVALRGEVTSLRTQLEVEQRVQQLTAAEAPPRYDER